MQMTLRWYGSRFDTVTLQQIRQIPGVTGVTVDVVKDGVSTVTIEHEGTLNTQAVADAIVEAGFTPAV
mgnify:CR=1 FL=1